MKKWLGGILILGVALCGGIIIFIPSSLKISHAVGIHSTLNGVNRYLLDGNKWQSWWPEENSAGENFDSDSEATDYNGVQYHIPKHLYNALELDIISGERKINSVVQVIQLSKDTVTIFWNAAFATSINPYTRLQQYRQAKTIKYNMVRLLSNLKTFTEKTINVYGYPISQIISKDSALITTSLAFNKYPETAEIYRLIDQLKLYAASHGAKENNFPMLNVRKDKDNRSQTMVAIPIDKKLPGTGNIIPKRFVPWKTLIAEVTGGPAAISNAYEAMKIYIQDNRREAMSIPFESLVTDRTIQNDTSKWVTLICQPVS